jgi:dTMP kinase
MKLRLPLFIVFEGIDGSGKTTISDMIFQYYSSMGIPSVKLMEPTEGTHGMEIRRMLKGGNAPGAAEQMRLFLLDREDDVERNIAPALSSRKMIIMDRYYYSNAAYQGAMGIDPGSIISANTERNFPVPDRVYLFDIEPATALERISMRNRGRGGEIFEKAAFLERVRDIYLSCRDDRFLKVNASDGISDIFDAIRKDIEGKFQAR